MTAPKTSFDQPAQTFDPATMTATRPSAQPGELDMRAVKLAAALDDAAPPTRQGDAVQGADPPERPASFDPADLPVVQPPAFGDIPADVVVTRQRGVTIAPDVNDMQFAPVIQGSPEMVTTRQVGPSQVVAGTLMADREAVSPTVGTAASWREAQDAYASVNSGFGTDAFGPPVVDVSADPATWPVRQPGDGTVVTRQAGMMGDIADDGDQVEVQDPYATMPVDQPVGDTVVSRQPAHGRMVGNVFMADRPSDGITHG